MNDKNCELLLDYINNILREPGTKELDLSELDESYCSLGDGLKRLHTALYRLTKQAEESLKIQRHAEMIESYNELFVEMLSKRSEWLIVVDQDTKEVLFCNKENHGVTIDATFCEACRSRLSFHSELLNWEATEQYSVREVSGRSGDGNKDEDNTYYRITSFPVTWKEHQSLVHVIVDITDEKRTAHNLTSKAYHDPGTGIKNRLFFKEYMESVLSEHREATLCYLDLDGLKYVNDKFGHLEGDIYIQNFVEVIRSSFRNGDTFARIGGDEFCLVLTGCIGDLMERKMADLLKRFQSERYSDYQCSFSYGIVQITGTEKDATLEEILREADKIMYECKRKNKEKYPELVR